MKLLADYRPATVLVAWDEKPTARIELAPEYKAHRRPMPDLLRQQVPYFEPIVEAFGYRNFRVPGNEADAKFLSHYTVKRLPSEVLLDALSRVADIPTLFDRWVRHYGDEVGRDRMSVSSRAHGRLVKYPGPGNVAELKGIARRLVVRGGGAKIEAGDVDEVLPVVAERVPLEDLAFEEMVKSKLAGLLARIDGYPVHDLYDKVLARVERPLFDLVLAHTGGNQLKAAEILGLNRNTLRKKLADLGIDQSKKRAGREDRALDGK